MSADALTEETTTSRRKILLTGAAVGATAWSAPAVIGIAGGVASASGQPEDPGDPPEDPEPAGEGCSPGYWKNSQHFASYPTGVLPTDLLSQHFAAIAPATPLGNQTLVATLSAGGGGLTGFLRHAVATFLNIRSGLAVGMSELYLQQYVAAVLVGTITPAEGITLLESFHDGGNPSQVCPFGGA